VSRNFSLHSSWGVDPPLQRRRFDDFYDRVVRECRGSRRVTRLDKQQGKLQDDSHGDKPSGTSFFDAILYILPVYNFLSLQKGGIFTHILKQLDTNVPSASFPPASCKFPLQEWRDFATISVFAHLAHNCVQTLEAASIIQALIKKQKPPPGAHIFDWYKFRVVFEKILFGCLPLTPVRDLFQKVVKCELDSSKYIIVKD